MGQSAEIFVRHRNKLLFYIAFSALMKALMKEISLSSILLVENMKGVRRALAALLKTSGYDVVEAEDCPSALTCLQSKKFDLVICEVCPSQADGATLLTYLSQQDSRPPVIAISSGNNQIAAEMSQLLSKTCANATLSKPFEDAELLAEIQKLLLNEIVSQAPSV